MAKYSFEFKKQIVNVVLCQAILRKEEINVNKKRV